MKNMKRLAILLTALLLVGCDEMSNTDQFLLMSTITDTSLIIQQRYESMLQSHGFSYMHVTCEHDLGALEGSKVKPYLLIEYKFTGFPHGSLNQAVDACEIGPELLVMMTSDETNLAPKLVVQGRAQYTADVVAPLIDLIIKDEIKDHL